ncbi:choline dehydrogenase (plasmid) [Mesorhizobium sp. ORM8.1]
MNQTYDYIIVGAGSAGCVLANRLSADPTVSVLLLETGAEPKGWKLDMPGALGHALKTNYVATFYSEPEPELHGRRLYSPRGRVLGGSSSVNGMVYIRGHAKDFDHWRDLGAVGWGYADVLPYFRRAEGFSGPKDEYRGDDGPLKTRSGTDTLDTYDRMWLAAGLEAGYPNTSDVNGYCQEGLGPYSSTTYKRRRWSTFRAYLEPIMNRPNLTVVTKATARRVVLDNKRATGVDYEIDRVAQHASARREVIVSGGTFGSPHFLMLSGIGNAGDLKKRGVDPVHDLPGVGENLIDHPDVPVAYTSTRHDTLRSMLSPIGQIKAGVRWFLNMAGPCDTAHLHVGGHIRSAAGVEWPDLQFHFLPLCYTLKDDGSHDFAPFHGFLAHVALSRPASRGRLWLNSADPYDQPKFIYNYFKVASDLESMRRGVKLLREIFGSSAFDAVRGEEVIPGPSAKSDEDIDAFLRRAVQTEYHPCGTCRIGRDDDPMAVLDAQCRVRGLDGLRVVDASVMPDITNGNLNAPTTMIAEKASDMILGRQALAPSNAPAWINPHWQNAQR